MTGGCGFGYGRIRTGAALLRLWPRTPGRGRALHGGALLLPVLVVVLASAGPAAAQSPDPAPPASGPAPDPAPSAAQPAPAGPTPAAPATSSSPRAPAAAIPAPTAAPVTRAAPDSTAAPKRPTRRPRRERRPPEKTPDPSPPNFDLTRPAAITEAAAKLDTPATRAAALALLLAAAGALALLTPLRRGLVP